MKKKSQAAVNDDLRPEYDLGQLLRGAEQGRYAVKAAEAASGAWSSEGRVEPSQEIREVRSAWDARRVSGDPDHG